MVVFTGRGRAYRRAMDSELAWHAARAALEWQIEAGADEAILDTPVNRYEVPASLTGGVAPPTAGPVAAVPTAGPAAAGTRPAPAQTAAEGLDVAVAEARRLAAAAADLPALAAAMEAYSHCELRLGARNTVFSDGNPAARVMIVGEAPGRDEDLQGRPFVGRAGQLLDRMLDAIGLRRAAEAPDEAVYITNVLPWRPPGNRTPDAAEIAMLLPFLERHVALADPQVVVLMGNTPCHAVLGRSGITRIRGTWTEALGRPVLPMFHPAYLLRQPLAKREAWVDLLTLRARLEGLA